MRQPTLLDAPERMEAPAHSESQERFDDMPYLGLPPLPELTDDGREWGDFDSCLTEFGTNQCTLDDAPARVIGSPRADELAWIEPVSLDAEPMRCTWDVVHMVMHESRAFCREDDDTDL